jgi:hypothetical protein
LAVNIRRTLFIIFLLGFAFGCRPTQTPSERKLLRIWSAPGASVDERAEAVDRYFTNGTPITSIISLLGTNYTEFHLVAYVWTGKPYMEKAMELTYDFGTQSVYIEALAPKDAPSLSAGYNGAHSSEWMARLKSLRTNYMGPGQLNDATNWSQPFTSDTNRTSSPGGFHR